MIARFVGKTLVLFRQSAKRDKVPKSLGHRRLSAEDIKVPIVRTNFIKGLLGAVPLVENVFHQIVMTIQTKTDRPLVRFPSCVAHDLQLHIFSILALRKEQLLSL